MASITVDDAQMQRLDMLAQMLESSPDTLVSLAIADFLAREEARDLEERVKAAATNPVDDVEAAAEERSLALARRSAIRRINRLNSDDGETSW